MEIKEYYKSDDGILLKAQVGIEENGLFTGIILENNYIFYITNNEIYIGHHPEDLYSKSAESNKYNETLDKVVKFFQSKKEVAMDEIPFSKVNKEKIIECYIDMKSIYLFNFSSKENPFINQDITKEYRLNSESLQKDISSFNLGYTLLKLDIFQKQIKEFGSKENLEQFENMLDMFGLKLNNEEN